MKKLIISAITAAALLFGFASCSGDLHDMNDAPIVDVPTKIVGAINYDGGNVFSDMVKVDELTSTYTFIYSAGMSANWGSPSDGVAFKVGYTKDDWNTCWGQETAGNTTLADGKGEVICKKQNAENISFAGLTDGKTYKITAKAGIASVSVSIEKADDIPSYILNANGILLPMSYTADGEKGVYKATVTPTSDTLELRFFDGTDNYGSSSPAIDVSGKDTNDDGPMASNPAVIEKLSTTMTTPAKFTGIKKVDSSKYYNYIVVLTIDGDVTTATITRVIPKHDVTFNIIASGLTPNAFVYINGSPWDWGGDWPFTAWNSKDAEKTKACLLLKDKFATADSDGNAKFGAVKVNLEDGKSIDSWVLKIVDIIGSDPTAYEPGTINYDKGKIPKFTPLSGKASTFEINVKNTGSAYEVTISEAKETPSTN